jgi:hypothetical protein
MAILSPIASASSIDYVVITINLFSFLLFTKVQSYLLDSLSNPLDGSSRKIIFEFPAKARATDSFLFYPVDIFCI